VHTFLKWCRSPASGRRKLHARVEDHDAQRGDSCDLPWGGDYKLTVRDVPVDGFWSISVYNADGFFERNDRDAYTIDNITATPNDDGSITVHFGGCGDGRPNCLPITDGWNYIVRLYRPRSQVLDGSWTFPSIEPA
jgi:hypothetical protein